MSDYEQGLYGFLDQDLDQMLETAKKHPFKVRMDFETRFKVWTKQVLVDRLMYVRKHPDLETMIRMYDLTLRDSVRLLKRATKELLEVADIVDYSEKHRAHLNTVQSVYDQRKQLILSAHFKALDEILETQRR